MATLYIEEFVQIGTIVNGGGLIQAALEPSVASQTVAVGAGSVASAAFNATTRLVRLHSDVACSFAFGAAPTATATSSRLAAGVTEYYTVQPGMKVAVITNS